MNLPIAFTLTGPDCDAYAFQFAQAVRCTRCEFVVDRSVIDPAFRVARRTFDICSTYDGLTVVSERFRAALTPTEQSFTSRLPNDRDFYLLSPTHTCEFAAERRGTRFENQCSACGFHESVVGATPAYLSIQTWPADVTLARTDLAFGSGDERHPLILVSVALRERLLASRLRGLEFSPAFGSV